MRVSLNYTPNHILGLCHYSTIKATKGLMRKITQGIHFRLSMLGVLPAFMIGLALAGYFSYSRITSLDKALLDRGESIIRQLTAVAATPIIVGDHKALQELVSAVVSVDDVVEVNITDAQGINLAFESNELRRLGDELSLTANIFPSRLNNQAQMASVALSTSLPEKLGSVSVVLSRQHMIDQQRNAIWVSLAILASSLIMVMLLVRRMNRDISEPVMALTLAVHKLSTGNLEARAEADAVAELAYLQAGFNAMAAEMKKNRDSLEGQVQQATVRLRETLAKLEKQNEELESARGFAEAQTELKSHFLAQMSHEIRTPMNGIIGFAELLANSKLDRDQAEKLGLIVRSSKNLLAISNEILDLSKLEAHKIHLENKIFPLRPVLEDVIALLCAPFKRVSVILWMGHEVPRLIEADPVRLQQVVTNLLSNALKFTHHGRIVIRVRALRRKGVDRLHISVSDSGSGISSLDIAKLFSPFQQLGSSAHTTENGAGLGLSISKNIVESMGGEIHLASRPGKGTSLWFDLPLAQVANAEKPSLPCCWVGLIESDQLLRQALRQQLEDIGMKVLVFDSLDGFGKQYDKVNGLNYFVYYPRTKSKLAYIRLPHWLKWCEERMLKPILLFSAKSKRLAAHYQQLGFTCLFHPVSSETLTKTLDQSGPDNLASPESTLNIPEIPQAFHKGNLLKILVADDNEINRMLLRAQLEKTGAFIEEVTNGKEALERIQREPFDLLLLDLQMPQIAGLQVLKQLRQKTGPCRQVPVVAVTAFWIPGQREALIQEGFTDCLLKPITEELLISLLERIFPMAEKDISNANSARVYANAILKCTEGNVALANKIANKLFMELPEYLEKTRTALNSHESETARQFVHKINGSASFARLDAIRTLAVELESALVNAIGYSILKQLCEELTLEIEKFTSLQREILDLLINTERLPDFLGNQH